MFFFTAFLLAVVSRVSSAYEFNHSISDLPGYLIEWTINGDEIELQLTAPTTGWIGFGISESGGMIGGDEFVAWVDDSTGQVVSGDYHSRVQDYSVPPIQDDCDDWVVLSGTLFCALFRYFQKFHLNSVLNRTHRHADSESNNHSSETTSGHERYSRLGHSERNTINSSHGSVRKFRYFCVPWKQSTFWYH